MHVRLGPAQSITAIDDGGVSMSFQRELLDKASTRVVLSLEVHDHSAIDLQLQAKRKKHAKENDEATANRHAGQIFAEMLGQVCHPEFYELENDFQEVNPLTALPKVAPFVDSHNRLLWFISDTRGSISTMQNCQTPISSVSQITVHGMPRDSLLSKIK